MRKVPQIVHERLKAVGPAVNHPEADALAAFADRSLSASERTLIVDHLSRCTACRDVVALALPEIEAPTPVLIPARRPWLTWPALRWGFAAAGVVAISIFGVLKYQQSRKPENIVARFSSPEAVTVAAPASAPPSAAAGARKLQTLQAPLTIPNPRSDRAGTRLETQRENALAAYAPLPVPKSGAVAGTLAAPATNHLSKRILWTTQQNADRGEALVAVPKQPSGNVAAADVESPASAAATQVGMVAGDQTQAQLQAPEPQPSAETDSLRIGKAKPPDAPCWTISDAGVLERSFDQGITWQDVDVTAASAQVMNNLPGSDSTSGVAAKKFNHRIAVKREELAPVFRVVTANGSDVWAGGVGGVLYHSLDAGNRWTHVVPISGDATLTGDIVSLDFPDSAHGRVTTSTAQVWTTSDDGQTWHAAPSRVD